MSDHSTVLEWLAKELEYADAKYGEWRPLQDEWMRLGGLYCRFGDDIRQYFHRAQILGLDNPGGRQALGKAMAVIVAALESSIRVFGGELPPAGRTSGDVS